MRVVVVLASLCSFLWTETLATNDGPFSVSVLSQFPPILMIDNFLSPEECDQIIHIAEPLLVPSETLGRNRVRKSFTHVNSIEESMQPPYDEIRERIFDFMDNLPAHLPAPYKLWSIGDGGIRDNVTLPIFQLPGPSALYAEGLQLQSYTKDGGKYGGHFDYEAGETQVATWVKETLDDGTTREVPRLKTQKWLRVATFLAYLSDTQDGEGGETVFPVIMDSKTLLEKVPELKDSAGSTLPPYASHPTCRGYGDCGPPCTMSSERCGWKNSIELNAEAGMQYCCCKESLKVRPSRGKVLLFFPADVYGNKEAAAYHGSCPLVEGVGKWTLQQWFLKDIRHPKQTDAISEVSGSNRDEL